MIMKASVYVCVLKKNPAMVSGDHESECVFVCVEEISSYDIW